MRSWIALSFGLFLLFCSFNSFAQVTLPDSGSFQAVEEQPVVTNVFYESDIRQALSDIASQTGINIIADPSVGGYITLEVKDLPLEECLRRMLSPLGLTFKKMDGYYLVGSASPDNPSFALLSTTELVVPKYLKVREAARLLSSFYDPFIKVDEESNTLAITASPEIIDRVKEDLSKIDVPLRQVMIEAIVTEFSKEARKSLGIDASWLAEKDGRTLSIITPLGNITDSSLGISYNRSDIPYKNWIYDQKLSLKALIQDGKVKIRANPRVATLEGQKATIYIAKEEYYSIVTGPVTYPYTQLEKIMVGVSLNITPYLSDKNEITVEIVPEVSDVIGTGSAGLPVVSRRTVTTKVRVKEGETIIIGGLLQKNESTTRKKIPLLGDIPILGYLFSNTSKVVNENEVVIFITPHILNEAGEVNPATQKP
jgi:type II secretory pathway component GspD/PulD (secretin)